MSRLPACCFSREKGMNMDTFFSTIERFTQANDVSSVLTVLCEQEKAGAIVLYAGTYSFDSALERFGSYENASFYIYATQDKSGYCVYINRMGCGIREDNKIFQFSHRYLYNKNHLSNCWFGEKDCRAGAYFEKKGKKRAGMKEIIFGDLDFSIVKSYKIMKAKLDNNTKLRLFGEFTARATVCKSFGLFGGVEIAFEIDNQDISTITKLYDILTQKYGKPNYIATGPLKVWEENDYYIVHGLEGRYYNEDVHVIKICFQKPYWCMLDYAKYEEYVSVFRQIGEKWNVQWTHNVTVLGKEKAVWMETEKCSYCISFSQRKFAFYVREKRKETEGIRMIPVWDKKGKYKTIEDLSMQLDTCFAYLKEYDTSLQGD